MRADTGPAAPVDRYSCQSLVEPAEPLPWLRVSRVARVDQRGVWLHGPASMRPTPPHAYQPFSYGPNELAANWAPAMVETALRSAEAKLSTEKLPPGSRGVVATSRMLAQS